MMTFRCYEKLENIYSIFIMLDLKAMKLLSFIAFLCHKINKRSESHMYETKKRKEPKRKFALWIKESSLELVRKLYKNDNYLHRVNLLKRQSYFMPDICLPKRTSHIFQTW